MINNLNQFEMGIQSSIVKKTMKGLRRNDDAIKNKNLYQKTLLCFLAIFICVASFAQYNNAPPPIYQQGNAANDHSVRRENIFLGGALQLGYYGNTFSVGGNPEVGYTIAPWLDAGLAFNLNYSSDRADPTYYWNNDTRTRIFNYGGGVFVRAYPVKFLFLELQPELNWVHESIYQVPDVNNGNVGGSYSGTFNSTSLIAGIGYTQRIVGQGSFFTMVGLDLLNNIYSPYRDYYGNAIPIVRVGFDIYLHPSKK